ncbi:hypothetical protein NADFUDRAFT_47655 [Nadsonia fulvescens var. elongata DSM 6958]|uniref:Uncharacterized protein n=1 Tax=Nadsonia fulvescens var. elongata DSM 6958 TaxID=857566 RepID=A0A1E3PEU6_9ASCO|nr:hypothetical protein NADFUDRAFT_47655 [Nadsonia fulvescens var. elongata DSM 6958]
MCKNAKNRAIYVFGHSVGAWIAQRVAVRLSQERLPLTVKSKSKSKSKPKPKPNIDLKFVGLITPTLIDIAKSEKGEKLCWWSSKIEKSVPGLSMANIAFTTSKFVSSCVPLSWQKRLITWVMGRDIKNHVVQATIKLLNRPDICHQCLRMAKEEMIRINSEFEPKDIEGFWPSKSGPQTDSETELDSSPASTTGSMNGVKIWIWFASNDHWVSPASRANLIERYTFMDNMLMEVGKGAMNMESLADVEHSFCVRKSEEFADITSKRILFFDQI